MPAEIELPPPSTNPTPGTDRPAPEGANLTKAFSDFDTLYAGGNDPPHPTVQDKVTDKNTPLPKGAKVIDKASPEVIEEQPKPEVKTTETKPPVQQQPERAGELRKQRDQSRIENEQLKARIKEFEEKLKAQPQEDPEKKTLTEKLTAFEKRAKELDEKLRYKAYEESDDYKEKYEQPFIKAYTSARKRTSELEIVERKDDMENVIQQRRAATEQDFDRIMAIKSDKEANRLAQQLFGEDANLVLIERGKVKDHNDARIEAIEDFRKTGAEREKKFLEDFEKQRESVSKESLAYWQKYQAEPVTKYPQLFKEIEGDEKGNQYLNKGFDMATKAFSNMNPNDPTLTSKQREDLIAAHAAVFNWATAGPRLAYQNKNLQARVKELETKLGDYEKTESPGGSDAKGRGTAGPSTKGNSMDSILEGMDKLALPR